MAARPYVQVAPMMDVSYQDFRFFIRLLTRKAQLWTEMYVENTLRYADTVDAMLRYDPCEHPVVCQVGGSNPSNLEKAVAIVDRYGYDEINLNCGCPSDRVCGKGEFGASLMLKAALVRDCVAAMKRATSVPVTVKTRLGVDMHDSEDFVADFIATIAEAGCRHIILHARKAWLKGLSTAQNRSIPPLNYARVFRLCRRFPHLEFSVNGGIKTLDEVSRLLFSPDTPPNLRGAMLGRVAYENPIALWDVDCRIYGEATNPATSRRQVLEAYGAYLRERYPATCSCHGDGTEQNASLSVHLALKPLLGLFAYRQGHRRFRRLIEEHTRAEARKYCGVFHILQDVVAQMPAEVLDARFEDEAADSATVRPRFPATEKLIEEALEASRNFRENDASSKQAALVTAEESPDEALLNAVSGGVQPVAGIPEEAPARKTTTMPAE